MAAYVSRYMKIPFAAYADDCTVTGGVALEMDRLSDFLASTTELEVEGAAFRALDDGRVVEAESAAVLVDDLCVIAATGPRGKAERRLWTRQFPVRVRVGPYTVVGYLHAPPTIDPFKSADRRMILPLTASVVEYTVRGELTRDRAEAVLVNRLRVDLLVQADETELGMASGPEVSSPVDPRAKDMTGDLFG